MHNIAIVYRTLTGNTKAIGHYVSENLLGCNVDVFEMDDLEATILLQYDGILIGTYTWGNGDLPYDAKVLYKQMNRLDFSGKVVGCFGSGDRNYPHFCAAVEILLEKARERGANTVQKGLKMHLAPSNRKDFEECASFAQNFLALLNKETLV